MHISERARICGCEAKYEFNHDVHIVRVFQWNDFDGNGDKQRIITCLFVGSEEYGRALADSINDVKIPERFWARVKRWLSPAPTAPALEKLWPGV